MILEARHLALARGPRTVLRHISARFEPGTVTIILGPNGAGKSTLLEALAGLVGPAAGAVTLGDTPLAALAPRVRARAIGYLPQSAPLHWNMEVAHVVGLGRTPHRGRFAAPAPADRATIAAAIAAADLETLANRPVHTLSGGERARVHLARLLAGQPAVLLADEPLANLDPRHQLDMLALFRTAATAGAAVLLVLHDLQAAARSADQLLLLADGGLLAAGPPAKVLTPALLKRAFAIDAQVEDTPAGLAVSWR